MSWFRKKSTWQRVAEPLADRIPGKAAVKSGAVAAGVTLGVTAASSFVSALRKKPPQS
jgi:hypothetical protein